MRFLNPKCRFTMLAAIVMVLFTLGSSGVGIASSNTISGRLWVVTDAIAHDASPANVPTTTPDVTFDVNAPLNFVTTFSSVQQWLTSGGAFNIVENTSGTLSKLIGDPGSLVEFTGFVTVSNGQTYSAIYDDGLTLSINGTNIISDPGANGSTTGTYTGPTGTFPFQLVYAECCSGAAKLQIDNLLLTNPEIGLTPATAANEAGTDHTVTATVDAAGAAISGQQVTFSVESGPNAGVSGSCLVNTDCTTDTDGHVSWTYAGAFATGSDTINACFTDLAGTKRCASATKTWVVTTLEVRKFLFPSYDSGRFYLAVEGESEVGPVGNDGTTGPVEVEPDTSHTVSESAATGTSMSNYRTTAICQDQNRALLASGYTASLQLDVGLGDHVTCTFVNQRIFSWFWWR
jgi:hypothetical protein